MRRRNKIQAIFNSSLGNYSSIIPDTHGIMTVWQLSGDKRSMISYGMTL